MFTPAMTYKQLIQEAIELHLELQKKSEVCPNTLAKTALDNASNLVKNQILSYLTQAQQHEQQMSPPQN